MPQRKKRIEKGIKSLKEQIRIHEEKRRIVKQIEEIELEEYYEKEINSLKQAVEKKEKSLRK